MPKATYFAIFFLIWWTVLFAVLPWGVRSQHEGGEMVPGTDPGAPVVAKLGRKLMWTTLVAVVLFAAFYVIYTDPPAALVSLVNQWGPHFSD
jgi:predicted secreted protein